MDEICYQVTKKIPKSEEKADQKKSEYQIKPILESHGQRTTPTQKLAFLRHHADLPVNKRVGQTALLYSCVLKMLLA